MKERAMVKINNKLGPKNKDEPTACTHSAPHSAMLHVYQGLDFFWSSCVMSSRNKTMYKSFVTKGDIMQQSLLSRKKMFGVKKMLGPQKMFAP